MSEKVTYAILFEFKEPLWAMWYYIYFIRKPVHRSKNDKITQVVSVIDGIQIQAQFQCDFYLSQLSLTK